MVRRKELYEAEEKTLQVMLAEEEEEKEKERREMQRKKQGTVICIPSKRRLQHTLERLDLRIRMRFHCLYTKSDQPLEKYLNDPL